MLELAIKIIDLLLVFGMIGFFCIIGFIAAIAGVIFLFYIMFKKGE